VGETVVDGLYVCAGFNGEGISNGPFAARLLADLVLDRDPLVDPSTFDPMRYPGDETFEIGNAVEWWDDK
jgi:sarcosine oxidase subunit beta